MRRTTTTAIAALALTGVGSALVVGFQAPDTPAATTPATTTTTSTGTTTSATTTSAAGTTGSTSTSASAATAAPTTSTTDVAVATTYADGTWTGAAVQEPWGTFQVEVTVSGGQITAVNVVSAPQDGHSSRINSQAIPVLTQATIAGQSGDVDLISGATWTSQSYATSLQAALDDARAAAEQAA